MPEQRRAAFMELMTSTAAFTKFDLNAVFRLDEIFGRGHWQVRRPPPESPQGEAEIAGDFSTYISPISTEWQPLIPDNLPPKEEMDADNFPVGNRFKERGDGLLRARRADGNAYPSIWDENE